MTVLGQGVEIPVVHLNEVHMEVREADGDKFLVMGPVALVLPLDAESAEWLKGKLEGGSKVQVVPAGALNALRTP
jgi:hypothetical protein